MSTEAELQELWDRPLPMDQVKERSNLPNCWADLVVDKFEPALDDNGLYHLLMTLRLTAPIELAKRQHTERLYIGTHKDPKGTLPDTVLNSPGLGTLQGIGRVTEAGIAVNINPRDLAAKLLNKQFTGRFEARPGKKKNADGSAVMYTNLARVVKLGAVPARVDGATGAAGPAAVAAQPSNVPAGVTFGE